MFRGAKKWDEAVVVKEGQVWAPPDLHWETGAETNPERGPQIPRPRIWKTEVRFHPIELTHALRHLAGAGEDSVEFVYGRLDHGRVGKRDFRRYIARDAITRREFKGRSRRIEAGLLLLESTLAC